MLRGGGRHRVFGCWADDKCVCEAGGARGLWGRQHSFTFCALTLFTHVLGFRACPLFFQVPHLGFAGSLRPASWSVQGPWT